jgi:hypothetical protein
MRRLASLILLIPVSAAAGPELGLAFKGGPNAATLSEEYRVHRYGFSGGLATHLRWPLADRTSLAAQTELLYTTRGSEIVSEGYYQGRSRETYLDLMVAARPEVKLGRASLYALLGGGLCFLLNANKENSFGTKEDITEGLRQFDLALLVGAGIALHLPRRGLGPFRLDTLLLEVRHDRGLIDSDPVVGGYKNRSSSLMLGLSFVLTSGTVAAPRTAPPPAGAVK